MTTTSRSPWHATAFAPNKPPTRLNSAERRPTLPPSNVTSKTSLKCQFYGTDPLPLHRCSLSSTACLSGECLLLRGSVVALARHRTNHDSPWAIPACLRETTSCPLRGFAASREFSVHLSLLRLSPRWGWPFFRTRVPRLTPRATICRCSAPVEPRRGTVLLRCQRCGLFASLCLLCGNGTGIWELATLQPQPRDLVCNAGFNLETENLNLTPLPRSAARSRRPHPVPPWPALPSRAGSGVPARTPRSAATRTSMARPS